jgi:hypothetical protein
MVQPQSPSPKERSTLLAGAKECSPSRSRVGSVSGRFNQHQGVASHNGKKCFLTQPPAPSMPGKRRGEIMKTKITLAIALFIGFVPCSTVVAYYPALTIRECPPCKAHVVQEGMLSWGLAMPVPEGDG